MVVPVAVSPGDVVWKEARKTWSVVRESTMGFVNNCGCRGWKEKRIECWFLMYLHRLSSTTAHQYLFQYSFFLLSFSINRGNGCVCTAGCAHGHDLNTQRGGCPSFPNQHLQPWLWTAFGKFIAVSAHWEWELGAVGCLIQLWIQTALYSGGINSRESAPSKYR